MKKILSVALSAVMLTGLISGCGGNETANKDGVTTVEIWSGDISAKQCWMELADEFNNGEGKEKGIEVEFKFSSNHGDEVDVATQNDQLPDMVAPSFLQIAQMVKSGDIVALEDIEGLKDYVANYKTEKIEDQNTYNGKVYSLTTTTMTAGLIYNKDLFKEAGIVDENGEAKPPATLDEMVEVAKKLTNKDKGVYGYSFPLSFGTYYTLWCPARNVAEDLTIIDYDNLTYDYTPWFKLFDYMVKMRDDGSLFPGADTLTNDTSRAYFSEGLVGMMPGMSWDVGVLTTQFIADCDWDVAPFPRFNEEDDYPTYQSPGGLFYITKNGAAKGEKIAEVYKWLTSSEVITRFYEKGVKIPYDPEMLAEDAKCDVPQFESFTKLVDDRYKSNKISPKLSIEGDNTDTLMKKIWAGDMTTDEAIKDINTRASAAFKKAYDAGEVDIEHIKEVNGIQ